VKDIAPVLAQLKAIKRDRYSSETPSVLEPLIHALQENDEGADRAFVVSLQTLCATNNTGYFHSSSDIFRQLVERSVDWQAKVIELLKSETEMYVPWIDHDRPRPKTLIVGSP